jgi:hypothetical protein
MASFRQSKDGAGGPFRFRVSDIVDVPLRGHLLRLRLVEGQPSIDDLAIGRRLRLASPAGTVRTVTITDHAVTAGRQTQQRIERTRELDVVISDEDAGRGDTAIGLGWIASGPVSGEGDGR